MTLKWLKRVGSIWDYVKYSLCLMLDIQNISNGNKLHNFFFEMQSCVQNKLFHQTVEDLPSVIAMGDTLVDVYSNRVVYDPTL